MPGSVSSPLASSGALSARSTACTVNVAAALLGGPADDVSAPVPLGGGVDAADAPVLGVVVGGTAGVDDGAVGRTGEQPAVSVSAISSVASR